MKYYSIQNKEEWVNLREAVVKSMSSQSGLYMPEQIPVLPASFFRELPGMKLPEIAFRVSQVLLGDDIPLKDLERMAYTALDFDIPLKALDQQVSVLELFHGPTLAFKDVGARYMAALFEYVLEKSDEEVTILAATSGDTGSAVADAFYNKKGVKVCILYPSGKVSALQEKQLTTMGGNITTYEVDGSFDECQRLVKMAFADEELNKKRNLTSANSINLARLLPQSFYYFYAWAQRAEYNQPVWISVPSGNFGNLCAGLIAWKMGLPVQRFIAATNSNHVVPDYLKSGEFTPEEIKYTLSNAMDVALPSNFPRIKELFQQSWPAMQAQIEGFWCNDSQTLQAMKDLYTQYHYIADPHGAIAWDALRNCLPQEAVGIFLETAHPAKFPDAVRQALGIDIPIPDVLNSLMQKEKIVTWMSTDYQEFREHLLQA